MSLIRVVFCLLTFVVSAPLLAGPLDPPVGPVASTNKTLTEIEPRVAINADNTPGDADSIFRITQPGSYYLSGNIAGVAAKHGIEIASGGVTLDLNGFELLGVPGSLSGIYASSGVIKNVAIANGSIRFWGNNGIDLSSGSLFNARVSDIFANANTGDGIAVSSGCTVINCSAFECSGAGIRASFYCAVTQCMANSNGGAGIVAGSDSVVTDCIAMLNATDGITCVAGCVVRSNKCTTNGINGVGAGIRATSSGNRIEENTCTAADFGIQALTGGNFIARNLCSLNTTNWSIAASNKCLVIAGVSSGAINGNSGGASPGSSDPNANYTH